MSTLEDLTLVRCTPAQVKASIHADPPDAPEDLEALLARAEREPDDIATWALVPRSDPGTLDLLSHAVTYRRTALVSRAGAEPTPSVAYGLSAVFTRPEYRRRGYARRMLQLLHYVLAPPSRLPPFPSEWGSPPEAKGFQDAEFSFLHSGIDGSFYTRCTQGSGAAARDGWVPKPPHTRLWNVPAPKELVMVEGEAMDAGDVAALQAEYETLLRAKLPGDKGRTRFAVVPQLSALSQLGPPSIRGSTFGVRLPSGWFTYLKLCPAAGMSWRITLSHVAGDVPFSAVRAAAQREGAEVIEYGGEGFTAWDAEGVELDTEYPKPCYCVYGTDPGDVEWVAPEMLIIEGVGVPGRWAWY